jgi:8-oxo-dGTP pyrophosphatase MutT (NUDIX family)
MSLLDRIAASQAFEPARYQPFRVAREVVGYVPRRLSAVLFEFGSLSMGSDGITLDPGLDGFAARSEVMAAIARDLRDEGFVPGWRDETYGVPPRLGAPPLLSIERAAATVFGTLAYGVHLNGYVRRDDCAARSSAQRCGLHLWVPRRAATKQTYPNRADALVAGAIPLGEAAVDALAREADEEAGIPPALAAQSTPTGVITYCLETSAGLERGVEFCHDLCLPADFVPTNRDGEVGRFDLLPAAEVLAMLRDGDEFKPNCALVVIDFLVRHGLLRPDEPDYLDVVAGLRRWDLVGGR